MLIFFWLFKSIRLVMDGKIAGSVTGWIQERLFQTKMSFVDIRMSMANAQAIVELIEEDISFHNKRGNPLPPINSL